MKKVGIIVVNYHNNYDTEELVESLKVLALENLTLDLFVINNESLLDPFQRPPAEKMKLPFSLTVINNSRNLGFAAASNQGIELALRNADDYLCLLNNDTLVERNFLANLIRFASEQKQNVIVSPKIYFARGEEFYQERYSDEEKGKIIWYAGGKIDWENIRCCHLGVDEVDYGQYQAVAKTDFATGCCLLASRQVFEKIGKLDEKYFAYWEDVDFCQRAKERGIKIFYCPQAVIWHKNARSSGGAGSSIQYFLQERNRLIFGLKFGKLRVKIHLMIQMVQFLFSKNWRISFSAIYIILKKTNFFPRLFRKKLN